MSRDRFVNLDVASAFSFLWGTFTPENLVERAKRLGQKAVALTDLWGTYGIVRFWKACRDSGIQAIPGTRLQVFGQGWVVLLAMDFRGYGNICRILSSGLMQETGRPVAVSPGTLKVHAEGVICITGVEGSAERDLARRGDRQSAGIKLLALKDAFRKDGRLLMGIQNNVETDPAANKVLLEHAEKTGLMAIALNHAAFLEPGDYQVHRILSYIQKRHHHRQVSPLSNSSYCLSSSTDMEMRLGERYLIRNTMKVAEMCRGFSFPADRLHPPVFQKRKSADLRLARKATAALSRKMDVVPADHISLLAKELEAVKKKDFRIFSSLPMRSTVLQRKGA